MQRWVLKYFSCVCERYSSSTVKSYNLWKDITVIWYEYSNDSLDRFTQSHAQSHNHIHKLRLLMADPHGGVTRSTHMWLRSLGKRARVGLASAAMPPCTVPTRPASLLPTTAPVMSYACVRGEADAFQKGLSALERAHSAGAA